MLGRNQDPVGRRFLVRFDGFEVAAGVVEALTSGVGAHRLE